MKKLLFATLAIALLLASSCKKDAEKTFKDDLIGTWNFSTLTFKTFDADWKLTDQDSDTYADNPGTFTFNEDGTFSTKWEDEPTADNGKYTIGAATEDCQKNNGYNVTFTNLSGSDVENYVIRIDGGSMYITECDTDVEDGVTEHFFMEIKLVK